MEQAAEKIKQDKDNWEFKDWDRHARVLYLLQKKRKTITEWRDIGERSSTYPLQWESRTVHPRIEEKIAAYLGTPETNYRQRECRMMFSEPVPRQR
jgi:hypothetical protein